MKKSDLKPGMVVEYENGKRRLVIELNNSLYLIGENNYSDVDSYPDSLYWSGGLAINKIFRPIAPECFRDLLKTNNLIWERKPTELTMEEIAHKFNIPVSQLKIVK